MSITRVPDEELRVFDHEIAAPIEDVFGAYMDPELGPEPVSSWRLAPCLPQFTRRCAPPGVRPSPVWMTCWPPAARRRPHREGFSK